MTMIKPSGKSGSNETIGRKAARHRAAHSGSARNRSAATQRPEGFAIVGQLDSKNRLSLPRAIRDAIQVGPGDSVFLNVDATNGEVPTVRVVKAINPLATMLNALAEDALREYHAGETIDFDGLMDELEAEQESVNRNNGV